MGKFKCMSFFCVISVGESPNNGIEEYFAGVDGVVCCLFIVDK
jgi:hypothetical protein